MNKPLKITVKDIDSFDNTVCYVSDSETGNQLFVRTFRGIVSYIVREGPELALRTKSPDLAVKKFNDLQDGWSGQITEYDIIPGAHFVIPAKITDYKEHTVRVIYDWEGHDGYRFINDSFHTTGPKANCKHKHNMAYWLNERNAKKLK